MKEVFPRILVSSVDVWNESSGSDTFTNLLSGYESENIANIYIRSGKPTSQVCNKYFYISENAVIKGIFKKNHITGMCANENAVRGGSCKFLRASLTGESEVAYNGRKEVVAYEENDDLDAGDAVHAFCSAGGGTGDSGFSGTHAGMQPNHRL